MTDDDPLARFEAHRPRLFGIAYRMLGSAADADDVLQEARVRWLAADRAAVRDARGFLVTMVSRLALDQLGSARARREAYVGPWLPEPIATAPSADLHDLSLAFLRLLERLSPAERAAFLLAEVFDYSHAEVAAILGKSEEACRQLAARARRAVRDGRPRPVDAAAHARVLAAFAATCASGDVAALERLLAADAACVSDGGGRARAARNVVTGANAVARLLIGLARKGAAATTVELGVVNGEPALVVRDAAGLHSVATLDVIDGQIATVCIVRNPDKLAGLGTPRALA
ncbi:MAG: RNA polymerase sigma factor SigJ [Myxococcales bacterium]|nr:RNA polymerase sigma factor SigJ [Myxococcales bacterium]